MSVRRLMGIGALALVSSACASSVALPGWNEFIVHPLINALVFLYDVFFHDFGIAIVLLTFAIRLALYPLFLTQLRSQRVQQELAPAIAELRKKHKEDRKRFAEEQMKLYRERGFNPASGCLPLLLQMPILFGLYSALSQVGCGLGQVVGQVCPGLTRGELDTILYPFVTNPIDAGDTLRTISAFLPWSQDGLAHKDPFFVLPVLAAVVTLVSALMTMPVKQPQTDDAMQRSMQSMVWTTPAVTLLFGLQLPAGLALYWIVSTLFSVAQQWLTSGWGRIGAFVPALPRVLPSPSAGLMKQETKAAVREFERDMAADPPRRRKRRR